MSGPRRPGWRAGRCAPSARRRRGRSRDRAHGEVPLMSCARLQGQPYGHAPGPVAQDPPRCVPPSSGARSAMPRSPRPPPGRVRGGCGRQRVLAVDHQVVAVAREPQRDGTCPRAAARCSGTSCTIRYASRETSGGSAAGSRARRHPPVRAGRRPACGSAARPGRRRGSARAPWTRGRPSSPQQAQYGVEFTHRAPRGVLDRGEGLTDELRVVVEDPAGRARPGG